MTCEEFAARVTDYLDGSVPFGERIGMWFHKLICHHCRRYLEQMRETVDLMDELDETEPPGEAPGDDLKRDLVEKFRKKQAE